MPANSQRSHPTRLITKPLEAHIWRLRRLSAPGHLLSPLACPLVLHTSLQLLQCHDCRLSRANCILQKRCAIQLSNTRGNGHRILCGVNAFKQLQLLLQQLSAERAVISTIQQGKRGLPVVGLIPNLFPANPRLP